MPQDLPMIGIIKFAQLIWMSSFVVSSKRKKFPFGPIYFIATLENVATSFQVDFMTFGACLPLQTRL